MDMPAKLSDLRRNLRGCHVAAFIDLKARMALAHDARSKPPQERLDGLADRALRLLNAPGLSPAPTHAIAISETNLEIFLRASPEDTDSLALVCGFDTETEAAIAEGMAVLTGLDGHA